MRYQCPKCHSNNLTVDVTIAIRLYQYVDHIETEDVGNDHEWDETSAMHCHECDYVGEAHEFDTEDDHEPR